MSPFPPTDDPLVQALQALLAREGGHIAVADRAEINDQTLYQIAYLKPHSRSGKVKSVGTSVRERLSKAFPGWMELRLEEDAGFSVREPAPAHNLVPAPPSRQPGLADALAALGRALAVDMPDDVRQDAADLLAKLAQRRGSERHQAELVTLLQSAASGPAARAANSR